MRRLIGGLWSILLTPLGVVMGVTLVWHLVAWLLNIPFHLAPSLISFILDLIIVYVLYDRWVYFFAQFVLPIQTPAERKEIYRRVRSGADGPALFIKNGQAILGIGEERKRGSGVIVVDTASAAVLRTDTEIRETIGPGVTFTSKGEYLAGTVDLRPQLQTIGPIPGDRPFDIPPADTPHKVYEEMKKRRNETIGLTRDGFEVIPTISIKFSVQKTEADFHNPDLRVNSRYGYNAEAVHKAIVRKMVQVSADKESEVQLSWNQLPAHLAINLWREYVRKFKFSELFTSEKVGGIQTIEEMINKRMRQFDVVELDDTGTPTGGLITSLEAQHLFERGIQVEEVKLHSVYIDPSFEERIIKTWETNWHSNALREQKQLEEWEALIDTSAREEAVRTFAELASKPFAAKNRLSGNPFITLQLLFQNLREAVVSDNNLNSHLEQELRKMDDFSKWLKDNNASIAFGAKDREA